MGEFLDTKLIDAAHNKLLPINPFVENFDMQLAQPLSKSVRLNGLATCLRLEKVYWSILNKIALANKCSLNALLSYIDREVHLRYGGVKNFSGLVRVVCVVYLSKPDAISSELCFKSFRSRT